MSKKNKRYCSHCGFIIDNKIVKCPKCHKNTNPKNKRLLYFTKDQFQADVDGNIFNIVLNFLKVHAYGVVLSLTIVASIIAPVLAESLENNQTNMPSEITIVSSDIDTVQVETEPIEEQEKEDEETKKETKKETIKEENTKTEENQAEVRTSNITSESDILSKATNYINNGNMSSLKSSLYFSSYFPDEYSKYNKSDNGKEITSFGSVYAKAPSLVITGDQSIYMNGAYLFNESQSLVDAGYTVKEYNLTVEMCSQSVSSCTFDDASFGILHYALLVEKDSNWYIFKIISSDERVNWMINYNGDVDAINEAVANGEL